MRRSNCSVGDAAHVDHVKLIGEGADALHVSTLAAAIGGKARFNTFTFTIGGAVVRNQLFLNFDGAETVAGIRGATLIKGKQHADTTLVVSHIARGCQSREVFKSVLDDEAHGVFQGRIIVKPGAQQTDAKMMTRALLLSDRPKPTTSRNWKSSPTTCNAATARPPAPSTAS